MPEEDTLTRYNNCKRKMRFPYVNYANVQSNLEQIDDTCQPDESKAYTNAYQQNTLSGFTTASGMLVDNTKKQKCTQGMTWLNICGVYGRGDEGHCRHEHHKRCVALRFHEGSLWDEENTTTTC
ncbi:Hypothetical predicted protein [Mytilus galloprovincialis]|uniref:Uncharacterized protein n=1 Tax=Mytilus galloprovincialis TaxID=29158 RepID=A0A8B6DS87_MYTGA|nr:Hypothetical predicted protein [Mytilus galloprovincialis]